MLDSTAPCLIAYWRHGSWLDAISCPLCRQKVLYVWSDVNAVGTVGAELVWTRNKNVIWLSRSARCATCLRRVDQTDSQRKFLGKSQTTTNVILEHHDGLVLHLTFRYQTEHMSFKPFFLSPNLKVASYWELIFPQSFPSSSVWWCEGISGCNFLFQPWM